LNLTSNFILLGYPIGWALMCDVLLRIPLSLFVKVHNVNLEVPGLQELLDHPVKKHFLVKDLPTPIRNMLFIKRKYMFSIHEIVTRLCYIGLVQFGPQILKEKDQVFVYLNRRTELLDTTSSAAGYHRIEDKPYPITRFIFSSLAVVENYWYEMWNTCINTCLGGRSVVEGKDILLEDLSRKIEMIQALKVKQPEEAEKYDSGFVPGDRKGAAGIDSAFFPHLKRNWNWVNSGQKNMDKKESRSNNPIKITKLSSKLPNVQIRKSIQVIIYISMNITKVMKHYVCNLKIPPYLSVEIEN
jgi:general transcription factor 3C polypeptide 1